MSLIPSLESFETKGRQAYQTSETLSDFANLVNHPLFQNFINKFCATQGEAEASLFLLKTWISLQQDLKQQYPDISNYQILGILSDLLQRASTRAALTQDHVAREAASPSFLLFDPTVTVATESQNEKAQSRVP